MKSCGEYWEAHLLFIKISRRGPMEQQFHQISYPIHLSHSRKLYTARKFLAKKIGILISMSIFEKGYKKISSFIFQIRFYQLLYTRITGDLRLFTKPQRYTVATHELLCMKIAGTHIFHFTWIIDTPGTWKNINPWSRFVATSIANSAHLPKKWKKWAKWTELAVLFSW